MLAIHQNGRLRARQWLALAVLFAVPSLGRAGTVQWIGGVDSNWTTATNWSTRAVPGSADDVTLNQLSAGNPYTVDVYPQETINSIHTDATSALEIDWGITTNTDSEIDSAVALDGNLQNLGNLTLKGVVTMDRQAQLSGSGDRYIQGTLDWNGGQIGIGGGTTYVSSGTAPNTAALNITLGGAQELHGVLENDGTTTWTNVAFYGSPPSNPYYFYSYNGTFNNKGTFIADGSWIGNYKGVGTFNNSGTLVLKNGALGFNPGAEDESMQFNNSGIVQIQAGEMDLNSGGNHTGTFTISQNAYLALEGDHTFNSGASVTGNGNLGFFYGGTTTFNVPLNFHGTATIATGTVNFNATSTLASLVFSQGTLTGAGDVTVTGNLAWNGGLMTSTQQFTEDGYPATIVSSGTTPNTATLVMGSSTADTNDLSLTNRKLENDGAASVIGKFGLFYLDLSNATFTNNGTFAVNSQLTVTITGGDGSNETGTFVNTGTFLMDTQRTTQIENSPSGGTMTFSNTGTVEVRSGELELTCTVPELNGNVLTAGTWIVRNNASLIIGTGHVITALAAGASVILDGQYTRFNQFILSDNEGNFTITNGYSLSGGGFSNAGRLTIGPHSSFAATPMYLTNFNTGTIDLAGGTLTLGATTDFTTIRQQLRSGFDQGAWDGRGIVSSSALTRPGTAVGYNNSYSTETLLLTWMGDTNLDGAVNSLDWQAMAPVGTIDATWSEGDFNYDGIINSDDYALFMLGEASQTGGFPEVPEPASPMLLAGTLLLAVRRRRSH